MSLLPHLTPVMKSFNNFGSIFVNKFVSLPTSHKVFSAVKVFSFKCNIVNFQVIFVTVSASVALLGVLAKYMRRKRQTIDPTRYRRIAGKRSRTSGVKSPNGGQFYLLMLFLDFFNEYAPFLLVTRSFSITELKYNLQIV